MAERDLHTVEDVGSNPSSAKAFVNCGYCGAVIEEGDEYVLNFADGPICMKCNAHPPGGKVPDRNNARANVIASVLAERDKQDRKWGENQGGTWALYPGHADGDYRSIAAIQALIRFARKIGEAGREGKRLNEADYHPADVGQLLGLAVLGEEVAEVAAAVLDRAPLAELRAELVQCAAVCVKWIEAIDKR
jgi:hypothetical protein